jgi:hypothetical protein
MFDVVALEETGGKIAGADPGVGSDDELCDAAVGLARHVSRALAGLAHLLAELDTRGVTDREYGLKAGSWLAREANVPTGVARSQLKIGVALRRLVEVDDAVIDGRLSVYHAKVLADVCNPRIADAVAAMQAELVGLAANTTFERWSAEVRGIAVLLDEDGGHNPNEDLDRNKLSIADTIDGITHLAGQLAGEHALGVREAIETRADDLFRRFSADHELSSDLAVPPRATLRALALAELCRAGHGTCTFPGCTAPPSWCDSHHLDPYHAGGRTDLARMASLCRHHHGVTHRRGWQMHATPDAWFWWVTPSGRTFWSQRHGRRRTGPAPRP